MKVVEWIGYDEMERRKLPGSIGGTGGWVHGQTWPEYLDAMCLSNDDPHLPYYKALREAVVKDSIRVGGDEHQQSMTPVFDDGTVGAFSYRAWGRLLAAIWNTEENTNKYSYMDFYMSCLVDTVRLVDRNQPEDQDNGKEEDNDEEAGSDQGVDAGQAG